jgi:hypothetical protein
MIPGRHPHPGVSKWRSEAYYGAQATDSKRLDPLKYWLLQETSTDNPVTGLIESTSTVAGVALLGIALAGAIAAQTTVAGVAATDFRPAATIAAQAAVSGDATIGRAADGAVAAQSGVSSVVTVDFRPADTVAIATSVAGDATVVAASNVTGQIDAVSTVSGSPTVAYHVTGDVSAASTVTGTTGRGFNIEATVTVLSAVSGAADIIQIVSSVNVWRPISRPLAWTPEARSCSRRVSRRDLVWLADPS